jgi:hypothetical protein
MWQQTNERFLDRRGCGDELFFDADRKASSWLAGLHDSELLDEFERFDDETDDAAAH